MAKFPVADGSPGTVSCSQLPPSQLSTASPPAERVNTYCRIGSGSYQIPSYGTDATPDDGATTRTFRSRVTIVPKLDVIVTLTVYVPGSLNAWVTSAPVAFVVRPSPNVQ